MGKIPNDLWGKIPEIITPEIVVLDAQHREPGVLSLSTDQGFQSQILWGGAINIVLGYSCPFLCFLKVSSTAPAAPQRPLDQQALAPLG